MNDADLRKRRPVKLILVVVSRSISGKEAARGYTKRPEKKNI